MHPPSAPTAYRLSVRPAALALATSAGQAAVVPQLQASSKSTRAAHSGKTVVARIAHDRVAGWIGAWRTTTGRTPSERQLSAIRRALLATPALDTAAPAASA